MRPIAIDVASSVVCLSVCVSVCVGYTGKLCKRAELIEMPFERLNHVDPRSHILEGVNIGRIHFSPRCGLLPNYFGHVVFLTFF